ncbi:hypothetical protein SBA2_270077 [Acidobacteriia bacterium SbA2]|nr:hypothetical protein SBA2_270077 [Acidobacteriia bacterium SbA2]
MWGLRRDRENDKPSATRVVGWAGDRSGVALTFRSAPPHADLKVGATRSRYRAWLLVA